ncbi:MAG: hypothetical protein KDH20_03365 [Rhodocyclaceae bacterium]|nr:hypothetical protein [Rhodocyclaceae bacterium]
MMERPDIVLELDQVGRAFPRDVSDIPSAILREMLWPRSLLNRARPDTFPALQGISLQLQAGEKLGVIGGHRSGKSILAGIASGVFAPTQGRVTARGSRLLFGRPVAGFKLSLSLRENLAIRGALAGLSGEGLLKAVGSVLQENRIESGVADSPLGNLSPYLIRKLGMEMLLQIPADILVIDELVSAGAGDARWATRAALVDRLSRSTALIVSTNFEFLKEVAEQSMVLHQGRLYGPFQTGLAIEYYLGRSAPSGADSGGNSVPDLYSDQINSPDGEAEETLADMEAEPGEGQYPPEDPGLSDQDGEAFQRRSAKQALLPLVVATRIFVDGEEYERARLRLLRRPGEVLHVLVELLPRESFVCTGVSLSLHSGTGMEVGHGQSKVRAVALRRGTPGKLAFQVRIPDLPRNHYGLAMELVKEGGAGNFPGPPTKLVVFGLLTERPREAGMNLDCSCLTIESDLSHDASDAA